MCNIYLSMAAVGLFCIQPMSSATSKNFTIINMKPRRLILPLKTQAGYILHFWQFLLLQFNGGFRRFMLFVALQIALGNILKFRKKNWQFDFIGGIIYFLLVFSMFPQVIFLRYSDMLIGFIMLAIFFMLMASLSLCLQYCFQTAFIMNILSSFR